MFSITIEDEQRRCTHLRSDQPHGTRLDALGEALLKIAPYAEGAGAAREAVEKLREAAHALSLKREPPPPRMLKPGDPVIYVGFGVNRARRYPRLDRVAKVTRAGYVYLQRCTRARFKIGEDGVAREVRHKGSRYLPGFLEPDTPRNRALYGMAGVEAES